MKLPLPAVIQHKPDCCALIVLWPTVQRNFASRSVADRRFNGPANRGTIVQPLIGRIAAKPLRNKNNKNQICFHTHPKGETA